MLALRSCFRRTTAHPTAVARDVSALAVRHRRFGRWRLCMDRPSSRRRSRVVAVAAAGSDRIPELAVPAYVVVRRQRPARHPAQLVLDGLLTAADCACDFPQDVVDYDTVIAFKHKLLEIAWKNFDSGKNLLPEYEQFCFEQAHWLEDYALFRALKDEFGGAYLVEWPQDLLRRA